MDNSTQSELLQKYLDGEMTEPEKARLEIQLEKDDILKEELERLILARKMLVLQGAAEKVDQFHQDYVRKNVPKIKAVKPQLRILRVAVAIAASFALLLLLVEGYKFYSLSPDRLYADNYFPYRPEVLRGTDSSAQNNDVVQWFEEKEYEKVLRFVPDRLFTGEEAFLRGMSYHETGDHSRAITTFLTILNDSLVTNAASVKPQTEYYLALSYLKNREYDRSLELLQHIHQDKEHSYHERVSDRFIRKVKMLKWK